MERASFYEMLADERRDFKLTFGMEQGQTFAMGDIPHAAAAPEEEEFAPVRLSEPEAPAPRGSRHRRGGRRPPRLPQQRLPRAGRLSLSLFLALSLSRSLSAGG